MRVTCSSDSLDLCKLILLYLVINLFTSDSSQIKTYCWEELFDEELKILVKSKILLD